MAVSVTANGPVLLPVDEVGLGPFSANAERTGSALTAADALVTVTKDAAATVSPAITDAILRAFLTMDTPSKRAAPGTGMHHGGDTAVPQSRRPYFERDSVSIDVKKPTQFI
jgi:hypothetical protein